MNHILNMLVLKYSLTKIAFLHNRVRIWCEGFTYTIMLWHNTYITPVEAFAFVFLYVSITRITTIFKYHVSYNPHIPNIN